MKIHFFNGGAGPVPGTKEPGTRREREPGRWAPLLIFIVVVMLALDYHLFVFR
jgi:hypothetical protein